VELRVTGEVRARGRNGRYAFVHDRGMDFAAGIWAVDPAFMLDLAYERLGNVDTASAREETYFAGARVSALTGCVRIAMTCSESGWGKLGQAPVPYSNRETASNRPLLQAVQR
jgi:hypothetical protein